MSILTAIQFRPRFATCLADVRDNFRQCANLINQAWDFGSELIVFPELCFTGYSFLNKDQAAEVCEKCDGPTFRAMAGVARELKSYVAWGYVELGDDENLYNSATLVDPSGIKISSYRKINLFGNDHLWAKPGIDAAPIVKTELGLMSVVVCRDLRNKIPKNIPRIAAKGTPLFDGERVEVVATCVNWGKSGFPSATWMDFAADNHCTLVVANRWGEERNDDFSFDFGQGGSLIIDPHWNVYTDGLKFNSDCVVAANTNIGVQNVISSLPAPE